MRVKNWICFGKGRKHCGKRRKCWYPAFSPFPTMFSKALLLRVVDCIVESEGLQWSTFYIFSLSCFLFYYPQGHAVILQKWGGGTASRRMGGTGVVSLSQTFGYQKATERRTFLGRHRRMIHLDTQAYFTLVVVVVVVMLNVQLTRCIPIIIL